MTSIVALPVEPDAVTDLSVSEYLAGTGLLLTFSTKTDPNHWATEIWASSTNDRSTAALVDTVITDTYLYPATAGTSKYFWIRSANIYGRPSKTWHPLSETAGVLGTAGGVDSKDLVPNAVSLHSFGATTDTVTGVGGASFQSVVTFNITNDSSAALFFNFSHFCLQEYSAGAKDTKWIIRDSTLNLTIFDWGTFIAEVPLPSLSTVYSIPAGATRIIILYWWAEDATVSITNRSFNFLAMKALG